MVPAGPGQLAADPSAPVMAWLAGDRELLALATSAVGLGMTRWRGGARVMATKPDLGRLAAELEARGSTLAGHLRRYLEPVQGWRLRSARLSRDEPHIMGIVNLTDDSFSGDGVGRDVAAALERAERLREQGAGIIDVGGETARADRPVVEASLEARAIGAVVGGLTREGHCVSVDTYKPEVARAGLEAGAQAVNDISGLTLGTATAAAAISAGAGYVLNYSYSVPKQRPPSPPRYRDVVSHTLAWMGSRLGQLEGLGAARDQVTIDPGIAFGKSHDEDLQVIRRLGEFTSLGQPLLLAHSRKNFIASVTPLEPAQRDLETNALVALAYASGARIFRLHDVEGGRRALAIARAVVDGRPGDFAPDAESWPWRSGASATRASGEPDRPPPRGQRW